MSEWKTYRLGEIVELLDYKRIPLSSSQRLRRKGIYPYYGAQGIIDYIDGYIFDGEYLLIAEDGENLKSKKQNIAQIAKGKYWVNNHAHILKSNGLCNLKYLCYTLNHIDISGYITGSAQPKLNQSNLLSILLTLPSIEKQNRIATFISSLDDKIELNRRINANLEEQAQALFKSWFVDFEPFKDGPFVDSELGKIPQGWKVETLSNLATVIKKGVTPSNSEAYSHYSIPAYDDAHFPEKQSGETIKSGKYVVYNNSILLSKLNPRIKRLWFIKTAEENAICSTEFIPIQTKDTDLISFVYYLIDNDIFYQHALSLVNGATGSHQRFHAEDIMQIPFAWNKDAAIDFAQKANYILQKIEDNIRENQTLSTLRDILLPKLMKGEIKVN